MLDAILFAMLLCAQGEGDLFGAMEGAREYLTDEVRSPHRLKSTPSCQHPPSKRNTGWEQRYGSAFERFCRDKLSPKSGSLYSNYLETRALQPEDTRCDLSDAHFASAHEQTASAGTAGPEETVLFARVMEVITTESQMMAWGASYTVSIHLCERYSITPHSTFGF
jgi:hypothetical protein